MLMPFIEELKPVHKAIKEAIVLDNGLICNRADDIDSAGIIVDEIWENICEAQIIVADATGRNPNVFYEIGLSHAIEKNVVILAQSISDIPFDLQHRRVILYDINHLDQLRIRLARAIENLCWRPVDINYWLDTSDKAVRVGLSFPIDGTVVNYTPIESSGRVIGLDVHLLRHQIQAFVLTDTEYKQDSAWIDDDGFWILNRIHLGAHRHRVFFRIYEESGRVVAVSHQITVTLEGPKPRGKLTSGPKQVPPE